MTDRTNDLLRIRPEIIKIQHKQGMLSEERFQNETIRPILNFQNPLLIAIFQNYIRTRKNVFHTLTIDKRFVYIENSLSKDQNFINIMKGLVIGHFTLEEYTNYLLHPSSYNKRVLKMIMERIKDQEHLFKSPAATYRS
jgi:hypothetical protein